MPVAAAESERLISLCARVVPELSPLEVISAAEAAGYGAVGFAFDDMAELDQKAARKIRRRLDDSPLECLDIDVVRLLPGPENPDHFGFLDQAVEIGAKHVLVVSQDPDVAATTNKFAALCDHAKGAGLGLVFEFLMITPYKTMDDALTIVDAAGRSNGKILIDTLHLARAGHAPEDIARFDPSYFPYIQLSDGPAVVDLNDFDALVFDAREGRLSPGKGELALGSIMAQFASNLPISLEVRSRLYGQSHPSAPERAKMVLEDTLAFLRTRD